MQQQRKRREDNQHFPTAQRAGSAPMPDVSWIRDAVRQPLARLLLVLIYARYSTEEQNPRSIEAQIEYCKRFLAALGIKDYELEIRQDVEMSGELRSRPGIDEVWRGVRERRWDLILVEDASRLYRHDSWAVELVGAAYDKKTRTVCINDRVDSAGPVEDWRPRLKEATRTHAQINWYTSHRIKRQQEYLWSQGAAVGNLRSGYRRRPSTPATEKEPAKGPYFDEIDERWAPEIHTAYEKIAGDDPPWQVGKYVSEKGLPKTSNSISPEWTDKNVKSLIRETIYRGWDQYRVTHSVPQLETGKKKPEKSETSQMLERDMPHLRIVSDELWFQANAAIDGRRHDKNCPSGPENPLYGIPRDSRSLLSTLFKCGICGAPMHKGGRGGRAYMCSAAHNRKCWNKATAEYGLIENAAKQAVREQLGAVDQVVDDFLRRLAELIGDRHQLRCRVDKLTKKEKATNVRIRRLIKLVETSKCPSEKVLQRIELLEGRLRRTAGKLRQLKRLLEGTMVPSRDDVLRRLQAVMADLDADQQTAGVALRKVIRRIEAIPFRQFNSTVIVLRGRIVVDVAALLSVELASVLSELHGEGIEKEFTPTTVTVDLFKSSTGPAYGLEAEALERQRNLQLDDVAKALGLNRRRAHIALQYGRALRQAGLDDPFIELTTAPEEAAHWGPHKKSRRPRKKSPRPADTGPATAGP
jgi:DNA invertase Pin-like site-specific DNA recombinase